MKPFVALGLLAAGRAGAAGPGPSGTCGLEDCGTACPLPPFPSLNELPVVQALNDPFHFFNGTAVGTAADWTCRRAEVNALLQHYELGAKPTSPTKVSGAVSSKQITVTVNDNGGSVTFSATVSLPTTGKAPFPALIGLGGSFLNTQAIQALGVAYINLDNNQIAQQNSAASRGVGLFYNLYGKDAPAGAMSAWAWAVSRMIDVIQADAGGLIDPYRLAVTGCSRNGKGALVAGALDERIALTIPQESGSGGTASWKVSDWMGPSVQTLEEIVDENVWFSSSLDAYSHNSTSLPFDHHLLLGMVAPRGLLAIENTGMVWLGNYSCWEAATAAHKVFEALQLPDHMGMSQVGGHNHCQFPASQEPFVEAFVSKFLLGVTSADTTVMATDGGFAADCDAQWCPWPVPTLV